MHGGVFVRRRFAGPGRIDQRALRRRDLALGRLEGGFRAAFARQVAAGEVLADVGVPVLADPQDSSGRSIALDAWTGAAGRRGRVAGQGAAVVLLGVAVAGGGLSLSLGLFVQFVEIGPEGVISLHAASAHDVLARGLGFLL